MKRFNDERDWFTNARLGLFIHWGLYAIHGYHEQEQWRAKIPRREYEKLAAQFNPLKFNPDEWLDLMQSNGMDYCVFTAKHHDGFCMWDTKETDFNSMNTPYGRDIVKMFTDACHARAVPFIPYYSVVDWHHPCYPNQGRHHELPVPLDGDTPDFDAYMSFLRAQVRELCTHYGAIHGLWWDMNVPNHNDPSINAMIRELQPAAVINNRGFDEGDTTTPERDYDDAARAAAAYTVPTEACQSIGAESWGYRNNEDYFDPRYLLECIDMTLAKGGNYLLNVGPKPDGSIPEKARDILGTIGNWYAKTRRSFENTVSAPELSESPDVLITRSENTVYCHMYKLPRLGRILLPRIAEVPQKAVLLNTGADVHCSMDNLPSRFMYEEPCLRVHSIPVENLRGTVPVIALEFEKTVPLRPPPERDHALVL